MAGTRSFYSMPLSERPVVVNESQEGEENWVALFLVCMLESSLHFLSRGEAEGMDGKCSYQEKGCTNKQNISKTSTQMC